MTVIGAMSIGRGENEITIVALLAALPVLGILGGFAMGYLRFRISRRGTDLLCLLGAIAGGSIALAAAMWTDLGSPSIVAVLGGKVSLAVSAERLRAIVALTAGAALTFVLARWESGKIGRSLLIGIPWAWSLGIVVVVLGDGILRVAALAILALVLFPALVPGYPDQRKAVRLLLGGGALAAATLFWLVAEIGGMRDAWPRAATLVLWLFAVPLPGFLVLWAEGTFAGLFWCEVLGGTIALTLAPIEGGLPIVALLAGLTALVAGGGALVANDLRRWGFFASLALLQQGASIGFMGSRELAFHFMGLYPLLAFGLWAALLAGGTAPADVRFKPLAVVPRWAKWLLLLVLVANVGGIMPGDVLETRLHVLATLAKGGWLETAVLISLVAGLFLLALGVLRFSRTFRGQRGASLGSPLRGALAALIAVLLDPIGLLTGSSAAAAGGLADGGLSLWLLVLLPVVVALALHAGARGPEGIARLWSWVSPELDRSVVMLTGPGVAEPALRWLSGILRFLDGAFVWLLGAVWSIVRSAGRVARLIDRASAP
jgi:hypothetical protein